MKVPLTIRISPLVYDAAKPEKQELQSVFFEKKCAAYQHFPVETYLAEQLFTILKYLELIPSMEVYDTTFRLLEQETIDGRHIYETLSFLCGNEEVSPQEKRIEMLESYDTYTYMKKRWEKYVRKQAAHRQPLFLVLLSAQIFPEECDNIFWFVQIKDRKGSLCMIWKISKYSDQIFFVR